MKKLTETLIQQRLKTCTTDLDKILQINITGRDLQDVSLLRTMTSIEILSLSVNKISSLADFQNCKNLKELYLRHNNISNLNELFYLRNLPRLQLLMLSENPCTKDPLYRMTVIKNLKHLIELDGAPITTEERIEAHKIGKDVFGGEPIDHSENFIPDGPQIIRTPTNSSQKLMPIENNYKEYSKKRNYEIQNSSLTKQRSELCNSSISSQEVNPEQNSNMSFETSKVNKNVSADKEKFIGHTQTQGEPMEEIIQCKFCRNLKTGSSCNRQCITIAPKNPNILSAVLNLIKELDYPSLQIINAEVISRLNSYQINTF